MRMVKAFTVVVFALAAGAAITTAQEKSGGGKGKGKGGGIPAPLMLTVMGYSDGGAIPSKFGCMGGQNAGVSPAISWTGAPAGTMSFAVIFHDTDVACPTATTYCIGLFSISPVLPPGFLKALRKPRRCPTARCR